MTTFFTSDTHFNHANIIRYCKRPFADVDTMNRELIARWNAVVTPEDTIWHLGDFAMGKPDAAVPIFYALNGKKHLIVGNHDGKKVRDLPWDSANGPMQNLYIDGKKITLIHNPGAVRTPASVVLHGHLHGMSDLHPFEKRADTHYIDVGVDCWDYRPVTLETLLA